MQTERQSTPSKPLRLPKESTISNMIHLHSPPPPTFPPIKTRLAITSHLLRRFIWRSIRREVIYSSHICILRDTIRTHIFPLPLNVVRDNRGIKGEGVAPRYLSAMCSFAKLLFALCDQIVGRNVLYGLMDNQAKGFYLDLLKLLCVRWRRRRGVRQVRGFFHLSLFTVYYSRLIMAKRVGETLTSVGISLALSLALHCFLLFWQMHVVHDEIECVAFWEKGLNMGLIKFVLIGFRLRKWIKCENVIIWVCRINLMCL